MFKQRFIAIIDVGSEDIAVYIGSFDKSRTFYVKSESKCAYDGFQDGNWFSPQLLESCVCKAIDKAIHGLDCKITSIYVGVPGEFTKVELHDTSTNFGSLHKVTSVDVSRLHDDVESVGSDGFASINYSTIFYTTDGKKRVVDPIGMSVKMLAMKSSYILCSAQFIATFNNILSKYSKVIKFISTPWAECISLFTAKVRDQGAILLDVGYISTDVSYIIGDGLCGLGSFSLGKGHIVYDLSVGLNIPYNEARDIKSEIDFTISNDDNKTISILTDEGEQLVKSSFVNMIATARVEEICLEVKSVIDKFDIDCPCYLKIYLTGNGLSDLRGIKQLISQYLDRACEIKTATVQIFSNKPFMSSISGLIQVISNYEKSNQGIFAVLLNK